MTNPDRLTALDTTFLHLEDHSPAHMHVASVMVFDGTAPTPQELVEHIVSRLHLVPRYRQRLANVPYGQGRPVWADDPHFNPRYHIRHTALPKPADDKALKQLAGRLFSQRLDRSKPLWEIWLVERMAGERFALIAKTHHALVDGGSITHTQSNRVCVVIRDRGWRVRHDLARGMKNRHRRARRQRYAG